ncbi:MAG: MMPL family transporter [Myxococcales bacterium]|nr:MMPL family transporter [Myxococcales bacterium]
MKSLFDGLHRHRLLVFLLLLAAAGACSLGLKAAFVTNNSLEIWFVDSDPSLKAYRESLKTFGNDEVVSIYVEPKAGILAPKTIELVRRFSDAAERMPFVERVYSLTTVKDFTLQKTKDPEDGSVDEELRVVKLVPNRALTLVERDAIREKLRHDPIYAGWIASKKLSGLMLTVQFKTLPDIDKKRAEFNETVLKLARETFDRAGIESHAAGIQLVYTELNKATDKDVATFAGLGYLVIFVLLVVILRSLWALALSLTVIAVTVVLTMGIFGLTGHQTNVMTLVLPTLVIIVSIADSVHLIQHFRKALATAPNLDRAARAAISPRAMAEMAWPCFLTSATTFVGFLSLCISEMRLLRELGLFAAIGVLFAFVVTFIVAAFLFPILPLKPIDVENGLADRIVARLLRTCRRWVRERPAVILIVFGSVSAVLVVGVLRLEANIYTLGFFPESAKVRRDDRVINERFGPYQPLEFTVEAKQKKNGAITPEFLATLARWQKTSRSLEGIGESFSIAQILQKLNRVNTKKDELPRSMALASQLLDTMGDRDVTDPYLEPVGRSTARVIFKTRLSTGNDARKTIAALYEMGRNLFGDRATIKSVGYWPLYARLVQYARSSQVEGFGLSFAVIFAVFFLLFRSVKLSVFAIIPNIVPVLLALGLMGFRGIFLDMGTVSIASIVICIAVDDTIHLTYQIRRRFESGGDAATVVDDALGSIGFALFATTLILVFGFLVFAFAQISTIRYFGTYLAIAVAGALAADLLLYPVLVVLSHRKRS